LNSSLKRYVCLGLCSKTTLKTPVFVQVREFLCKKPFFTKTRFRCDNKKGSTENLVEGGKIGKCLPNNFLSFCWILGPSGLSKKYEPTLKLTKSVYWLSILALRSFTIMPLREDGVIWTQCSIRLLSIADCRG